MSVKNDTFHITLEGYDIVTKRLNADGAVYHVFVTNVKFFDKKSGTVVVFEPVKTAISHLVIDPTTGKCNFDLPAVWAAIAPDSYELADLEIAIDIIWSVSSSERVDKDHE